MTSRALLTPDEAPELVDLCLRNEVGEPARRTVLLTGIPYGVTASLRRFGRPADQITADVAALLTLHEVDGVDGPPLLLWMANARRMVQAAGDARRIDALLALARARAQGEGRRPRRPRRPAASAEEAPPDPATLSTETPDAAGDGVPVALLVFADDRAGSDGRALRELVGERKGVGEALAACAGLRVVGEANTTADDLFDLLDAHDRCIAVLHFGGHVDGDGPLVEDAAGRARSLGAGGLARRLGMLEGLRLVFFNGCGSRAHVAAVHRHSRAVVIATESAVRDDLARRFAVRFYRGLARGLSVRKAFGSSSSALEAAMVDSVGGPARLLRPADGAGADRCPWVLCPHPERPEGVEWRLPFAGAGAERARAQAASGQGF